jgi:hypothetical protein
MHCVQPHAPTPLVFIVAETMRVRSGFLCGAMHAGVAVAPQRSVVLRGGGGVGRRLPGHRAGVPGWRQPKKGAGAHQAARGEERQRQRRASRKAGAGRGARRGVSALAPRHPLRHQGGQHPHGCARPQVRCCPYPGSMCVRQLDARTLPNVNPHDPICRELIWFDLPALLYLGLPETGCSKRERMASFAARFVCTRQHCL